MRGHGVTETRQAWESVRLASWLTNAMRGARSLTSTSRSR